MPEKITKKTKLLLVVLPDEISLILFFMTLQEHFESLNLSLPELIDGSLQLIITIITFAVSFCF